MRDPRSQPLSSPDERDTDGPGTVMPFAGFDPPESNFWRLPNNWFDLAARFTSWAEHKVVEYILRHTWGYHEYDMVKLITMDEFMHGRKRRDGSRLDAGCGMAENSIKKGIADAVTHGFLIVRIDDSDRGRIKKYYAPRMRVPRGDRPDSDQAESQTLTLEGQEVTPGGRRQTLGGNSLIPSPRALTLSRAATDPPTEQTPLETHLIQERSGNNSAVVVALANSAMQTETPAAAPLSVPSQRGRALARPMRSASAPPVPGSAPLAGARRPVEPAALHGSQEPPFRADLVGRLVAEGIAAARARALVAAMPSERIERQLAWLDRRACRDRAGTLIRAIQEDYAEPVRNAGPAIAPEAGQAKYFRGAYALCPGCGSRPCASGCANL